MSKSSSTKSSIGNRNLTSAFLINQGITTTSLELNRDKTAERPQMIGSPLDESEGMISLNINPGILQNHHHQRGKKEGTWTSNRKKSQT